MQADKKVQIPDNTDLNQVYLNQNQEDLDNLLEEIRIKPHEKAVFPVPILQVEKEDKKITIGSLGDFSVIIGKPKSRKTFFSSILVAACLKLDNSISSIKGVPKQGKRKVIYFDTEQSRPDVIKVKNRIAALSENDKEVDIDYFPLRKFSTSTRLALIERELEDCSNVGLVIIDGARDLVTSINNEEQATEVASRFLRWTEEKQIHLITILHQNKGDNNARGHLGTELINKAQTVLSVSKSSDNKNISIVESEYCRGMDIPSMAFEIDDLLLPRILEDYVKPSSTKSSQDLDSLGEIQKFQFLNELLTNDEYSEGIAYRDLLAEIKRLFFEKYDCNIGDTKVKRFITHCRTEGYLRQEKKSKPYFLGEFISEKS